MSKVANTNTPRSSILNFDFVTAPFYVENIRFGNVGKGVRVKSDAVVYSEIEGQADIPVKAGGVLFEAAGADAVSFYDEAAFKSGFSRLLHNGEQVKLSESTAIQLLKIREAEDTLHLKDVLTIKSGQALEALGSVAAEVAAHPRVQAARKSATEVVEEAKVVAGEFADDARALTQHIGSRVQEALRSPKGQLVKRFAWGKFTKG